MSLALYIHFPFCTNLCSYCDFYKCAHNDEEVDKFLSSLKQEIELSASELDPDHRIVRTLYIGGGTPSLIKPEQLADIIAHLKKRFRFDKELEFSLEANPESVTMENLKAYAELGVNRPIFGVQSFDLKALKKLGRKHNMQDTHRAVYLARALGITNFGIDMIFGLPGQTSKLLSQDLQELTALDPPHVSYYQLTVEHGTVLEKRIEEGKIKLPGNDLCAAFYSAINKELESNGYYRYEVSSFARPGYECRHNMTYWEGGEYLGLGPSAHSYVDGRRFANIDNLAEYNDAVAKGMRPIKFDYRDTEQRISETIMLGLRTTRGIDRKNFQNLYGRRLEESIDPTQYENFIRMGFIDPEGERVKLTERGLPLADEIIERLVK
jgi:oxygen-independent coproporphyrinogen-3 oxidase